MGRPPDHDESSAAEASPTHRLSDAEVNKVVDHLVGPGPRSDSLSAETGAVDDAEEHLGTGIRASYNPDQQG